METSTNAKKSERSVGSRLLERALMPIVATAASAAAAYAAKKAPDLIDKKVVPKVRELVSGAGDAARELPGKARSAAGDAGDVAEQLTGRVKSVAGNAGQAIPGRSGSARDAVSSTELERRLKERAKHRAARQKASR